MSFECPSFLQLGFQVSIREDFSPDSIVSFRVQVRSRVNLNYNL
jgi:hypothetical protein